MQQSHMATDSTLGISSSGMKRQVSECDSDASGEPGNKRPRLADSTDADNFILDKAPNGHLMSNVCEIGGGESAGLLEDDLAEILNGAGDDILGSDLNLTEDSNLMKDLSDIQDFFTEVENTYTSMPSEDICESASKVEARTDNANSNNTLDNIVKQSDSPNIVELTNGQNSHDVTNAKVEGREQIILEQCINDIHTGGIDCDEPERDVVPDFKDHIVNNGNENLNENNSVVQSPNAEDVDEISDEYNEIINKNNQESEDNVEDVSSHNSSYRENQIEDNVSLSSECDPEQNISNADDDDVINGPGLPDAENELQQTDENEDCFIKDSSDVDNCSNDDNSEENFVDNLEANLEGSVSPLAKVSVNSPNDSGVENSNDKEVVDKEIVDRGVVDKELAEIFLVESADKNKVENVEIHQNSDNHLSAENGLSPKADQSRKDSEYDKTDSAAEDCANSTEESITQVINIVLDNDEDDGMVDDSLTVKDSNTSSDPVQGKKSTTRIEINLVSSCSSSELISAPTAHIFPRDRIINLSDDETASVNSSVENNDTDVEKAESVCEKNSLQETSEAGGGESGNAGKVIPAEISSQAVASKASTSSLSTTAAATSSVNTPISKSLSGASTVITILPGNINSSQLGVSSNVGGLGSRGLTVKVVTANSEAPKKERPVSKLLGDIGLVLAEKCYKALNRPATLDVLTDNVKEAATKAYNRSLEATNPYVPRKGRRCGCGFRDPLLNVIEGHRDHGSASTLGYYTCCMCLSLGEHSKYYKAIQALQYHMQVRHRRRYTYTMKIFRFNCPCCPYGDNNLKLFQIHLKYCQSLFRLESNLLPKCSAWDFCGSRTSVQPRVVNTTQIPMPGRVVTLQGLGSAPRTQTYLTNPINILPKFNAGPALQRAALVSSTVGSLNPFGGILPQRFPITASDTMTTMLNSSNFLLRTPLISRPLNTVSINSGGAVRVAYPTGFPVPTVQPSSSQLLKVSAQNVQSTPFPISVVKANQGIVTTPLPITSSTASVGAGDGAKFSCPLCKISFPSTALLMNHAESAHTTIWEAAQNILKQKDPVPTSVVPSKVATKSSVVAQKKSKPAAPAAGKTLCLPSPAPIVISPVSDTSNKIYQCWVCKKTVSSSIIAHLAVHGFDLWMMVKSLKCYISCLTIFKKATEFEQHMITKHNDLFMNTEELWSQVYHNISPRCLNSVELPGASQCRVLSKCINCGMYFKAAHLLRHGCFVHDWIGLMIKIENATSNTPVLTVVKPHIQTVKCFLCAKIFASGFFLTKHMVKNHIKPCKVVVQRMDKFTCAKYMLRLAGIDISINDILKDTCVKASTSKRSIVEKNSEKISDKPKTHSDPVPSQSRTSSVNSTTDPGSKSKRSDSVDDKEDSDVNTDIIPVATKAGSSQKGTPSSSKDTSRAASPASDITATTKPAVIITTKSKKITSATKRKSAVTSPRLPVHVSTVTLSDSDDDGNDDDDDDDDDDCVIVDSKPSTPTLRRRESVSSKTSDTVTTPRGSVRGRGAGRGMKGNRIKRTPSTRKLSVSSSDADAASTTSSIAFSESTSKNSLAQSSMSPCFVDLSPRISNGVTRRSGRSASRVNSGNSGVSKVLRDPKSKRNQPHKTVASGGNNSVLAVGSATVIGSGSHLDCSSDYKVIVIKPTEDDQEEDSD